AFTLVLVSLAVSLWMRSFGSDRYLDCLPVLAVAIFVSEFVFGIFCLTISPAVTFIDALLYRILLCIVYDFVIAAILLFPTLKVLNLQPARSAGSVYKSPYAK
ncbi:MAG: hypothetical protein J6Y65_01450, partial [Eggerthellaceae bacterium]|nr:hypothetical protein [Eggerthellaceae bacterium]